MFAILYAIACLIQCCIWIMEGCVVLFVLGAIIVAVDDAIRYFRRA